MVYAGRISLGDPLSVLLLMGPTAAGKSALAMEMAARFNAEIVSVDSAAIYQAMHAGTAKPSPAEQARIPHHLIDIVSPLESYSVERFRQDAVNCVGAWDRLPKVMGGVSFVLGILWPTVYKVGGYPSPVPCS